MSDRPNYSLKFSLLARLFLLRLYLSMVRVRTLHEDVLLNFLRSEERASARSGIKRFWGFWVRQEVQLSEAFDHDQHEPGRGLDRPGWLNGSPAAVRGSARGGKEALAVMVQTWPKIRPPPHRRWPQGPKAVIKPGLIRLAQLSKGLIIPIYISVDRAWVTTAGTVS